MTSDLEARLARQGQIWDNLYGRQASQRMVEEVRRLVGDGSSLDDALARAEGDDDDEGTGEDFIVPRG